MTSIAWELDDELVKAAQQVFLPVWEETKGNDGYVSFELDPLLEDEQQAAAACRAGAEICRTGQAMGGRAQEPDDQGAGDAGRARCAGGPGCRRRHAERHADFHRAAIPNGPRDVWRGRSAQERARRLQERLQHFRLPRGRLHGEAACRSCSPAAKGLVGIVNAKRVWQSNQEFWKDKNLRAAAGDRLCQHRDQEADRSAG